LDIANSKSLWSWWQGYGIISQIFVASASSSSTSHTLPSSFPASIIKVLTLS